MTRKVGREPALLRRSCTATPGGSAVRVEDDDVPGAEVVGVVAPPGKPEVRDRPVGSPGPVLVVPEGGARAGAKAAPRVALGELGSRAALVDGVSEHGNRAGDPRDESRRRLVAGRAAGGDVARGDDRLRWRQQRQGRRDCRGQRHAATLAAGVRPGSRSRPRPASGRCPGRSRPCRFPARRSGSCPPRRRRPRMTSSPPPAISESVPAPPTSSSSPSFPATESLPPPPVDAVVAVATREHVVAGAAEQVVVRQASVEGVAVVARPQDEPVREVAPRAQSAAAGELVRAGEAEDLDHGRERCRGDVDVRVRCHRDAVRPDRDRVGPGRALDRQPVGRVAEQERDLDLGRARTRPSRPGRTAPPDWSIVSVSTEPAAPVTRIESVLAVVAAPQAAGSVPNRISCPGHDERRRRRRLRASPSPPSSPRRTCSRVTGGGGGVSSPNTCSTVIGAGSTPVSMYAVSDARAAADGGVRLVVLGEERVVPFAAVHRVDACAAVDRVGAAACHPACRRRARRGGCRPRPVRRGRRRRARRR